MLRLLKFIKQEFPFVWCIIDIVNGYLVKVLYEKKIVHSKIQSLENYQYEKITYRVLKQDDVVKLINLIARQPIGFDDYFKPHSFDIKTLYRLSKMSSFLMLGAFDKDKMIGYFFIRFFANGNAFRGKMVDAHHQGRGVAKAMGRIMTEIALGAGFRLFATISKSNYGSMASSAAVNEIKIIRELPDDYVYIEYCRKC